LLSASTGFLTSSSGLRSGSFARNRRRTPRRISIANRDAHTVNATFVDDASEGFRFAGLPPSLRQRATFLNDPCRAGIHCSY